MSENICAPATQFGNSAIAIIRCSGSEAISLVNSCFKGKNLNNVASHTLNYGFIVDGLEVVDEVVCAVFKAPHSFDGENMVEIDCHGGTLVVEKILNVLLKAGFRLAENGEFSKRAFLNGRLDLTQAEAVMDLIAAQNDLAHKASINSLRKSTSKLIKDFRSKLIDILGVIAVDIDYPEYEDSVEATGKYLVDAIKPLISDMEEIIEASKISTLIINGVKTALIGKPNVGKSSLLNMLLDEDKAIVSDIAGTTRDQVEGILNVGNITLKLIDTAGIRESEDPLEKLGIERSTKTLAAVDLVLLVLDGSRPLSADDEYLLKITKDKRRIVIANKADLPSCWCRSDAVAVSTVAKSGLSDLIAKIKTTTGIAALDVDGGRFMANRRQLDLLEKAHQALNAAYKAALDGFTADLVSVDLNEAFDKLGQIIGEANPDELLTNIFKRFCLGK